MAFIVKTDPTVIHIKLTDKGRQQLASGKLTFSKFSLGDSEINYAFNEEIGFDTFEQKILRPKDNNPNIVSFLEETISGATMITLPTVVANTSVITNTAPEKGFFVAQTGGTYALQDTTTYVKNPYGSVEISTVTGGTGMTITQSSDYVALPATNLPEVGDYIMIKWANPYLSGTTGTTIDQALPYLWYKIEYIESGTSLASNNLFVGVDKPLPDFDGNGAGVFSLVYFYPNSNNREVSGDSIQNYYGKPYITDFLDTAVFSFIQNWDCGIGDSPCSSGEDEVPVWNMSIIFTDEVAGVQATDYNYTQYYTKELGGFVRYIQQISPWIKKIGVIHYTNQLPYNTYGEGLISGATAPTLELPTIMWHKETGSTIGVTLSQSGSAQTLSGLSTTYFDLADEYGNVVGKVFTDLQVFVIEDQELLFAMSYKANRNWTLPEFTAALNVSLCPNSDLEVTII